MLRRFLGAAAATAAAPATIGFFLTWVDLVMRGDGQPIWGWGEFADIVPFGIFALVVHWKPLLVLLVLSWALGWGLERAGALTLFPYVICGAGLGLGAISIEASPAGFQELPFILTAVPAGGIYWRIVIRRDPQRVRQ